MADKREVKYADENFYNEAVRAYIDHDWGNGKHYTPNAGFRRDIAVTVKTYEDLCLWEDLLGNWGYWRDGKYHKRNPFDIKGLLTVFEFKQREAQRKKDEDRTRRESLRDNNQQRVPVRNGSGPVLKLSRSKTGWAG